MRQLSVLVALSLACATTKGHHTTDALKKATLELHQGMPSTEVQQLLGPPDSAEASLCGQLYGTPWKCTTWDYFATDSSVMDNLRLRFQGEETLLLNSWGKF